MRVFIRRFLTVAAVFGMAAALDACAGEARSNEGEAAESGLAAETGEHESPEGGVDVREPEGEGEHDGSEGDGEGREGSEGEGDGEHGEGGEREGGEHGEGGEGGEAGHEEGGGEGEEGGEYIGIGEGWDATRNGARLTLAYDPGYDVFMGRVLNTTESTLCFVRVEVHLADGPELGPTERKDVPAGGSIAVELPVNGVTFDSWTAHPEISRCSG